MQRSRLRMAMLAIKLTTPSKPTARRKRVLGNAKHPEQPTLVIGGGNSADGGTQSQIRCNKRKVLLLDATRKQPMEPYINFALESPIVDSMLNVTKVSGDPKEVSQAYEGSEL